MEKEKLIQELKESFEKIKKELKIKSSYEEVNRIFFIEDYILRYGYVSPNISRQISSRIVETYNSWLSYLNYFLMPSPGNVVIMMEIKMLDDNDRKIISELVKKISSLTSRNSLIGLTKDKKEEAKFIDDSLELWEKSFKPAMISIMTKINKSWSEEKEHGISRYTA